MPQPNTAVATRPRPGAGDVSPAQAGQNVAEAKRASILARVASRFGMDPAGFANTLRQTVFKSASDTEFAALLVVADQYGLNPLTKEIYAFPQKGGGIVPLVSIDGWIRIMNDHPQFDGIEFTDIPDEKGGLLAIESVIYRKDRTRPIRVTEYLDECSRQTDPWKKSPARMLRHRSLIQCARIAFGFSGIYTDDDVEVGQAQLGGDVTPMPMRTVSASKAALPTAETAHEPVTGEIEQDEPAAEGRDDADMGEQHLDAQGREIDAREAAALDIIERAGKVELLVDYQKLADEVQPHIDAMMDEDMAGACNKALRDARKRVTGK